MIIMRTITVTGRYTGQDKRGTIIGGALFKRGAKEQTVEVTEETFLKLKSGVQNGWFEIIKDNYDVFLANRKGCLGSAKPRKEDIAEPAIEAATMNLEAEKEPVVKAEADEAEVIEVEVAPKAKAKAKAKAKTKEEQEEAEDNK